MTQVLFNNVLAVVGVITGLSGLIISLYLLNKEKVRFSVYHPTHEEKSTYAGFNAIYNGSDVFGGSTYLYTPYLLLIWLQITNKSKSQTTIIEMSLKIPGYNESILYSRTSDEYDIASTYIMDDNGNIDVKSWCHIRDTVKPPIAIEPFSTVEGYFFFRDLNIFTEETIKAVLKIKTPQGNTKHKIVLSPSYPELVE